MADRRDMMNIAYRLADEWHMNGYDINDSTGCILFVLVLWFLVETFSRFN